MRRSRRNGHSGPEFGGSGEDSFVAVVVTKLTGALLFILLLTMVIMALLPKTVDLAGGDSHAPAPEHLPLAIATPESLPEAIVGRPYAVALAATGGRGPLNWSIDGALPEGLAFDRESGQLRGTPQAGTPAPVSLVLRVSDGTDRAVRESHLVVYQSDQPLTVPSKWQPKLPPIPLRAWLEQGVGFLILWLVHALGMNTLAGLERWSLAAQAGPDVPATEVGGVCRRYATYRVLVRLASLAAAAALAFWLVQQRHA
jgi:hypothetical protein